MMNLLLKIFLPSDQFEAIVGDLMEEYSSRAASGKVAARLWYLSQGFRTVMRMLAGQLMEAPVSAAMAIFVAALVLPYKERPSYWAASAILNHFPVYHHVTSDMFWLVWELAVTGVLIPVLLGLLIGALSRNREMAVIAVVSLLALGCWVVFPIAARRYNVFEPAGGFPPFLLLREIAATLAILGGGILSKLSRERQKLVRLG